MTLAFKCSRAYANVIGGLRLFDFAIEEGGETKEKGRKRRTADDAAMRTRVWVGVCVDCGSLTC